MWKRLWHTWCAQRCCSCFQVVFLWRPRRPFAEFARHDPRQALHTHSRPARLRKSSRPCPAALSPALERPNHGGQSRRGPWEAVLPHRRRSRSACSAAGGCWLSSPDSPSEEQPPASGIIPPAPNPPDAWQGSLTPNPSCSLSPSHLSYPQQRGRRASETDPSFEKRRVLLTSFACFPQHPEIAIISLGQGSSRTRHQSQRPVGSQGKVQVLPVTFLNEQNIL